MTVEMTDKVAELEARLEVSKFDYEAHAELIQLHRSETRYKELDAARVRMADVFSLTAGNSIVKMYQLTINRHVDRVDR